MERKLKRKESNPLLASDSDNDREPSTLSDKTVIDPRDVIGTVQCLQLCWSAKIVTVEPLFFIYAFGVSFFIPVFQQYLYQSYGHARILNGTVEKYFCLNETFLDHVAGNGTNDEVEGESTRLVFYVTLADIITSVTAGLIIGPLTDKHGRKIALLLASFSSLLGSLIIICTVYLSLDLHFLILASFVSASLGGYLVMLMATLAYVADVSTQKTRTLRIGIIQAVHNLAQTLAFITSGIWLQETNCDFRPLMWVIVVCYSLSILYTVFMFPESLSHRQRINRTTKSNSFATIWHGLLLFLKPKLVTVKLWVGLLALCVAQVNLNGASVIGTYFFIHKPLDWDPEQIGYFGSYNSVLHGVMLTVGLPLALVIGCSDLLVCIVALLFSSGAYTFIGFVTATWQMYVSKCSSKYCCHEQQILGVKGVGVLLCPKFSSSLLTLSPEKVLRTYKSFLGGARRVAAHPVSLVPTLMDCKLVDCCELVSSIWDVLTI